MTQLNLRSSIQPSRSLTHYWIPRYQAIISYSPFLEGSRKINNQLAFELQLSNEYSVMLHSILHSFRHFSISQCCQEPQKLIVFHLKIRNNRSSPDYELGFIISLKLTSQQISCSSHLFFKYFINFYDRLFWLGKGVGWARELTRKP